MAKVFVFPGQGAQSVGMGRELYESSAAARAVFDEVDDALNQKLSDIIFNGPMDELTLTSNVQPAIMATSIAMLRASGAVLPEYVAGHSLGEYCAMYASGVMSLETALKAIQKRADLMGQTKGGAMAAVLNSTEEALKESLKEASEVGYVDVANYNSPAQVVITGDEKAVAKAGELLLAKGARRVVPLAVSGAFHSKFMENAGLEFEKFVADLDLNNAEVPVFTNAKTNLLLCSLDSNYSKNG